jgi:DNA-binding FadR family transcriptional regulator
MGPSSGSTPPRGELGRALDSEEATLLLAIAASPTPVGSRRAAYALRHAGVRASESTVSRLLRRLDQRALTQPMDAKGRVLTDLGRREVQRISERARNDAVLREIREVQSVKELLDLLYARRGVEREAARGAARNAKDRPQDVERLRALVAEHHESNEAGRNTSHGSLTFHRVIGEMADNRSIDAVMHVLFAPVMDRIEAVLDIIIVSRDNEQRCIEEHLEIIDALVSGDANRADDAMARHLTRLIEQAEEFAATEHGGLMIDRLLNWAQPEHGDAGAATRGPWSTAATA